MKCVKLMKLIWTKPDFLGDKYAVEAWYRFLRDLTFEQLTSAIERYTLTRKFPPTIAELREQVVEMQADKNDWSDGWNEVMKAVGRFGYTDEAGAMQSMSPMTREVVKRLGWMQICQSDQSELMALRANFRMIYQQKSEGIKEELQLPHGFAEKLQAITGRDVDLIE